jgi:hypothetical protein
MAGKARSRYFCTTIASVPNNALRDARTPHSLKYTPIAAFCADCLWFARYSCAEICLWDIYGVISFP